MIGNYFYNETIRKTVIAFGTLFNNIFIKKTDESTGNVLKTIKVPIAYGPMQKFLARIEQQPNLEKNNFTLPRLSFEITSYAYDPSRKAAPITKFILKENSDKSKVKKVFMPVPYDIGFRLSFAAKLQDDVLQILEQILPFFQPHYSVTMNILQGHEEKKDIPFTLTNISFKDEYEGDFGERRAITYDLDFLAKTYFYNEIPTNETGGIIKRVQIDYATNIKAPREVRYVVTPQATKDYNDDNTTSLSGNINTRQTLLKVVNAALIEKFEYIRVNQETMRVESIDGNNVIVERGAFGTTVQEHFTGDQLDLITAADNAAIEIGDDFGFDSDISFFQDYKEFSPSQGTDV